MLQEAALAAADSVDPLAARIGAVNTLVRQADGSLRGYNTDCGAALDAIEAGLSGLHSAADEEVGSCSTYEMQAGLKAIIRVICCREGGT